MVDGLKDKSKIIQPVIFGEVLFDCFSSGEEVLGGAPLNVAWNLRAFGLDPILVSRVGEDQRGAEVLSKMKAWGLRTDGIQVDAHRPTGVVSIEQSGESHTFSILENQAYDFIEYEPAERLLSSSNLNVPLFYHGSLALRSEISRNTVDAIRQHFCFPFFVDINLREPWWSEEIIFSLIRKTSWLKLNEDELQLLSTVDFQDLELRAREFTRGLPQLELLIVTMDARGAMFVDSRGNISKQSPPATEKLVDTVGAGDAFASVVILGVTNAWPIHTILERALSFSSQIVAMRGATSEDSELYNEFKMKWEIA
jgi:fructokinase